MLGYALPYLVDLSLILALKSVVGHAGNTVSPEAWASYKRVVVSAIWISLALSAALSLPRLLQVLREQAGSHADRARGLAWACGLSLAYGGTLVANGALVFFTNAVAWMLAGGAP